MTIWVKISFAVLSNKWVFTCLLVILKFFCGSSHQMCSLPSPCSPVLNSGFCLLLFDYRRFKNTHKNRIKNTYRSFILFTSDCYFPPLLTLYPVTCRLWNRVIPLQHVSSLQILYLWRLSASLALQTSVLQPYWTFSTSCIYHVFMVSFRWNVLLLSSETIPPSKLKSKSLDAIAFCNLCFFYATHHLVLGREVMYVYVSHPLTLETGSTSNSKLSFSS